MALQFLFMRGSRNFCDGDGGRGGGVQAQLPVNRSDNVLILFSPQLILQFYRGCPMVNLKKSIIFQGFIWGPTFFRGPSLSRGPNAYFYRNPYDL